MALVFSKEFNTYLKSQNEKAFDAVKYIDSFVWDGYDLLEPERIVSQNKEQHLYEMLNNSKKVQKKFVQLLKDSSNDNSDETQPNTFAALFHCLKEEYKTDDEAQSRISVDNFDDFDDDFDDEFDKRRSQKVPIYIDVRECEFILDAISTFEDRAKQAKYFRPDLQTNSSEKNCDLNGLKQEVEKALVELRPNQTTRRSSFRRR